MFLVAVEQLFEKVCALVAAYERILKERDRTVQQHGSVFKRIL